MLEAMTREDNAIWMQVEDRTGFEGMGYHLWTDRNGKRETGDQRDYFKFKMLARLRLNYEQQRRRIQTTTYFD